MAVDLAAGDLFFSPGCTIRRELISVTSDRITSISDVIADRIRALRKREGLSREEVAAAARAAGAPVSCTATALGNIETGRRDQEGRRRRDVSVDELVWLAAAAGQSPLALLGERAEAFGASTVDCPRCAGERGQLESVVRADVAALGELQGLEFTHAQTAYVLAEAIDAGGGDDGAKAIPALTKELRATIKALTDLRAVHAQPPEQPDDPFDGLDEPE